jgi:outer membrane protein OmpA-like peptidoglycan-associated protein/Tol biopolymer transport system component
MLINSKKNIESYRFRYIARILLVVIVFFFKNSIHSQDKEGEMFYIAENYIDNENFDGAINLYQRILDEEPDNAEINFKLGFCYLNSADQKEKAIEYIEKSVKSLSKKKNKKKNNYDYLVRSYYLARAYQATYRYDEALNHYIALKEETKNKQLLDLIDKQISDCAEGKSMVDNPVDITITNMGDSINSEFSDHSPVLSADESVLIFTSRRKGPFSTEMDYSGEYDENIYISYNIDGVWSSPKSIGNNINTPEHEASIGLSVDGQQLLIYKSDDEGSIYSSKLVGDLWQVPEKLGPTINTKARETDACFSPDGNKLYFTSDRKGGYGGLDIYECYKLVNGGWSEAKNLGPTINSSEDERAPFMHADGVTLYFSSKGHGGLGGFDIFSSKLNEFNTWEKPQNLGFPINTSSDDVFYITTPDRKRSYYASNQETGLGKTDIYVIGLKETQAANITVMTGKVYICRGSLPEVSITVLDYKTDEVIGIYAPNSKTGKFLFVLNKGGHYKVIFEANGKIVSEEQLIVPENAAYQQLYKAIQIPVDPPCKDDELAKMEEMEYTGGVNIDNIDENGILYDESIKVENILFPSNQAELLEQNASLNKLAGYLVNNPKAVIEVGAYADASGKAAYNYKLSLKRGESVKEYLVKRKVNPNQVVVVSYGEENPIALNKNPDGTWNKEGQKYNRRIEFRVLKQGASSLLVKPITNIPQEILNLKYKYNYQKSPTEHLEIEY